MAKRPRPEPTHPLVREMIDAMRYEMASQASLVKNGETWAGYVRRLFTPERVVLGAWIVITLTYQAGGTARELKQAMDVAVAKSVEASEKANLASREAETTSRQLKDTQAQIEIATSHLSNLDEVVVDLKNGVAMAVKRPEFRSAIEQEIKPRLDRIERKQEGDR
ncbi:MAG TPA: hypothetical protein VF491_17450 [Vicinamibacterales bacterium]